MATKPDKADGTSDGPGLVPRGTTLMASDIAGAIATSMSIAPIAFSVEDRLLLNAIMIGRTSTAYAATPEWTVGMGAEQAGLASFRFPGEVMDAPDRAGGIRARYRALLAATDKRRRCSSDVAKAAVAAADALVSSLNAVSE